MDKLLGVATRSGPNFVAKPSNYLRTGANADAGTEERTGAGGQVHVAVLGVESQTPMLPQPSLKGVKCVDKLPAMMVEEHGIVP